MIEVTPEGRVGDEPSLGVGFAYRSVSRNMAAVVVSNGGGDTIVLVTPSGVRSYSPGRGVSSVEFSPTGEKVGMKLVDDSFLARYQIRDTESFAVRAEFSLEPNNVAYEFVWLLG